MTEKDLEDDYFGKELFCITYRNVSKDFDLCIKAARRQMSFGEKIWQFWLPWLGLISVIPIWLIAPPFKFTNGGWQLLSIFSLLYLIIPVLFFVLILRSRYRSKKLWNKEENFTLHFYAFERAFVVFEDTEGMDSMSPIELQKFMVARLRWDELTGFEIGNESIFLIEHSHQIILISNRDFSGTIPYNEVCNQLRSILEPLKSKVYSTPPST